jgi:CheY-like chemotaxis protein
VTAESRPLVLVIDDDADLRAVIGWALEARQYEALRAQNGAEALQLMREGPRLPDAILLDLMMPVMDGAQFRAAQRSDARLAQIPVALLTGHAGAAAKAAELDLEEWCQKPLDLKQLLAVVARLVGHQPT